MGEHPIGPGTPGLSSESGLYFAQIASQSTSFQKGRIGEMAGGSKTVQPATNSRLSTPMNATVAVRILSTMHRAVTAMTSTKRKSMVTVWSFHEKM